MSESMPGESAHCEAGASRKSGKWGPVLFLATLAGVLVFFWWLLIYSGGVEIHHG